MEPIHPALREELKRVYPRLTDADIDRYEELLSLRFTLDPEADAERIRELDAERERLVRRAMPRLGELENAFFARGRIAGARIKPQPRIEVRPSDEREQGP